MGRFLVMDIVFYGGSMNYDQGTGNYQELKKITKWDGRQYTLVSRYALRYSLLETAKMMGLWKIADADELQLAGGEGNKKVIQPSTELLISGKILEYPEFDLFGYLITSTKPQNFRESPVKISHAISMTPFNYDALFNANLGLANRVRKKYGDMKPNPFTAEEHITYYQYTIVVDIDRLGKNEVYLLKEVKSNNKTVWKVNFSEDDENYLFEIEWKEGKTNKKESFEVPKSKTIDDENISLLTKIEDMDKIYLLSQEVEPYDDFVKNRVKNLILAVTHLVRNIKGKSEDLSPKLMIIGFYKNGPYKTYKDRIFLRDKYIEEEYDEISEEPLKNGKKVTVKHKVSKSKKPIFEIVDPDGSLGTPEILSNEKIQGENGIIETLFNSNEKNVIKIFYDPSIEVQVNTNSDTNK